MRNKKRQKHGENVCLTINENAHKISSLLASMEEFFQGKVTQLNKYKFVGCILSALKPIKFKFNKKI